ncbi:MAG: thymidine phosphorylase [Candidatus Aegiribacteria sp.]|nr:thymidine phosphorylase [Candidatus Aegiribacteria sp.]MBD3294927.1 thymidine phosphorylase [Candidatus Fermentibacteria bacterium]
MKTTDLIRATREGRGLTSEQVYDFAAAVAAEEIPDYQISAWLMAAYIRGLDRQETLALTLALRDSGRVMEWSSGSPLADKHSTGGVGDKISLILAPLAAAAGLRVPMISGRSLGHTGGTLDKLESIPGMSVELTTDRFMELVETNGVAMSGQTSEMAPADGKLYALRDATSTVTSIPLITASILSKKLAENTDALVFDVKVGEGAFMKNIGEARKLAGELTGISRDSGVSSAALLTAMDYPLGMKTGNALEVEESIAVLQGEGPDDVRELTVALTAAMLTCAVPDRYAETGEAEVYLERLLDDGSAFRKFQTMVESQGGDLEAFDSLPDAPFKEEVKVNRSGLFSGVGALEVGEAVRSMGGGRYTIDQEIRHDVGWQQLVENSSEVKDGDVIGIIHAGTLQDAGEASMAISSAVRWDKPVKPLVREKI